MHSRFFFQSASLSLALCAYVCMCYILRKFVTGQLKCWKITNVQPNISSGMAQVPFFSSLVLTFGFKLQAFHLICEYLVNDESLELTLLLSSTMKSCPAFRLAQLHLTSAISKGQAQGHAHFDCKYLVNGDDTQGKYNHCRHVESHVWTFDWHTTYIGLF